VHDLQGTALLLLLHLVEQVALVGVELGPSALDGLVDERELVVRCVDDRLAAGANAIAERASGMVHVEVLDVDRADLERIRPGFEIVNLGEPGLRLHREIGRLHLIGDVLGDILLGLSGTEEVDAPSGDEGRNEEGQPRDVIPVVVRENDRELADVLLLHELVAERYDAAAGIADDDVVVDANLHAGSVAAHPAMGREGSGVGAAHPPESHVAAAHQLSGRPGIGCASVYLQIISRISWERSGLTRYSRTPSSLAMFRSWW